MIKIKRGLDLPIAGEPVQKCFDGPAVTRVGVVGPDYVGLKPTFAVAEGDRVKKGQLLFSDKKTEGVVYTAPAAGTVSAIHRGRKRALLSVEIRVEGDEQVEFKSHDAGQLAALEREAIQAQLLESGLWTALRTRPFSAVPEPGSAPSAIFVAAIDTRPLAMDPMQVLADEGERFGIGLQLLAKLTDGPVYVAKAADAWLPGIDQEGIEVRSFAGPHPAGLVGTHIHFLHPVGPARTVWHIGYQDVLALASLFTNGVIDTNRTIALAGPQVRNPRLLTTRVGANLGELTHGELNDGENRVISGCVLSGRQAFPQLDYLGRYHNQVSVIREDREHEFLGWLAPGAEKHSIFNLFVSKLAYGKRFAMTSTTNGTPRAMIPTSAYEAVMPLDVLASSLLRELLVGDTDAAIDLGCLELDEEDLALCTYVCTGKYDYAPILRKNLLQIQKDG